MNPLQAMQLAMKETEMQELIKDLIGYRSKHGSEKFNKKVEAMRNLLKEKKEIESA